MGQGPSSLINPSWIKDSRRMTADSLLTLSTRIFVRPIAVR